MRFASRMCERVTAQPQPDVGWQWKSAEMPGLKLSLTLQDAAVFYF